MPFRNRISRRIHPICFGMFFRFYLIKDLLWKTLLNFFEQRSEANLILEHCAKISDGHTGLFHSVTIAKGNAVIVECVVVDGDAIGSTNCVHTAVALTDRVLLLVLAVEVELEVVQNLVSLFGQTIFLTKGMIANFTGAKGAGNLSTTRVSPFSSFSS